MKRASFFPAIFLLIWATPALALTVLSDVDDTLKISNVLNPIDAAARVLSHTAFTGMPEALRGIAPHASQFIYLSARPQILSSQTAGFLNANLFPKGQMIHRQGSEAKDPLHYKAERIRQIFLTTMETGEHFILIGDDTQADPEAYALVAAEFSDRIDGIFIHQITGRMLPASSVPYLTSYDLAERWLEQGWIASENLSAVTASIVNEKQFKNILPGFQACPKVYEPIDQKIASVISEGCAKRVQGLTE
jgi:phosphatidate phosphatase APP1